ncbi:MAG: tetratricopeptide repeat protein [Gemmatimonadetes bacterium]|nr:tetratricopeptide repeat protein [Gemmatimonadota bacterium]
MEILTGLEGSAEMDHELALYNKVGDLYLKNNEVNSAVEMYERAAHRYMESGLPNNAIALCNKILRYAPGRTAIYLMLGELMLERGFGPQAQEHFLEYVTRMSRSGQVEAAFRALVKLTNAMRGNDVVREMVKEQLEMAAQSDPENGGLAQLLGEMAGGGDAAVTARKPSSSELVFINLDDHGGGSPQPAAPVKQSPPVKPAPPVEAETRQPEVDAFIEPPAEGDDADEIEAGVIDPEPTSLESGAPAETPAAMDLEPAVPATDDTGVTEDIESFDVEPISIDATEPESETPTLGGKVIEGFADIIPDETPSEPAPSVGGTTNLPDMDVPDLDFGEFEGVQVVNLDGGPPAEATRDGPASGLSTEGTFALEDLGELPDVVAPDTSEAMVEPVKTIASLEAAVEANPDDGALRRELAEMVIESGDRPRGLDELDRALEAYERSEDWAAAMAVTQEILLLDPKSVPHLQKRVEFTYRNGDQAQLVPAYLELANALFASGAMDPSRAVYERVLELDSENEDAREGLATLAPVEVDKMDGPADSAEVAPTSTDAPAKGGRTTKSGARGSFVDLGDLIMGEDGQKNTRMVGKGVQSGDEQRDFDDMLREFRRGIEANIDDADASAHYDLGVAFKEMGLVDEGIAEFQKALRNPDIRLQASEALGHCFYEKGQLQVAATVMRRAVEADPAGDEGKIGLLYWLGRCDEEQQRGEGALTYYQRVFAVDINFQDVGQRVDALTKAKR